MKWSADHCGTYLLSGLEEQQIFLINGNPKSWNSEIPRLKAQYRVHTPIHLLSVCSLTKAPTLAITTEQRSFGLIR